MNQPLQRVLLVLLILLTCALPGRAEPVLQEATAISATATATKVAKSPTELGLAAAERFGRLALECVHREYPNKIAHVLQADADAQPPRQLTPAFYGCYDWHSAVHGHWLLARLARAYPDSSLAQDARAALARSLTPTNIAGEVRYFQGQGRVSFERPYGLAWLLQLAAELREWDDPQARQWAAALEPLETIVVERLVDWIPKLTHPIRIGEHAQTAFAFGLIADWARIAGNRDVELLIRRATIDFYLQDRDCPMAYEPSGHDFLSPCLAEADLMRRFLVPLDFAAWLGAFLPSIPHDDFDADWLQPATVSDPEDPKLAHLDGLNLARAWMIEGIVSGLPDGDPRVPPLVGSASAHRRAGLAALTGEHYEGGHWLGSFAMYLVSSRGGSQVLSSGQFDVVYRGSRRSPVTRELVEQDVLPRAHQALVDVTQYLGMDYDGRILLDISPRHFVPNQTRNIVRVPASRLGAEADPQGFGISVVHEITHVLAASAYRPDRFYDDGLAVHLQAKFGTASSYPDFGEDLHRVTVEVAAENGGYLPLETVETTRRRTRSQVERRLAYLQEGSFTRYLIDHHGLEDYLRIYRGEDPVEVVGHSREMLWAAWRAFLDSL